MTIQASQQASGAAAEVLYATAEALMRTPAGSQHATLLQERMQQFIHEERLRHLLCDDALTITLPQEDTVCITCTGDIPHVEEKLRQIAAAFRGI